MPQTKKRTTAKKKPTNTKKKTASRKNKQGDNALKYIFAIIVIILTVLAVFQLGIVGVMLDSFFNYLFGMSRYLTYILILVATIFITFYKGIPKTRRTVGAIVLQLTLLLLTQIVFHFAHTSQSKREPVQIGRAHV